MQPCPGQQRPAKGQPLGGIVVAGDQHDRNAQIRQVRQQTAQQLYRPRRRGAPVVDVPCDHHGVRPPGRAEPEKAIHPMGLIPRLQQGDPVEALAQVQVCQVDQFHGKHPRRKLKIEN